MKNAKIIMLIGVLSVVLILIICILLIKHHNVSQERKLRDMDKIRTDFEYSLFIFGDTKIQYDKAELLEMEIDRQSAVIRICYYNHFNGKTVSCDYLMEQYVDFCNGGDNYKELLEYSNYIIEKHNISLKDMNSQNINPNDFLTQARISICEEYGVDFPFENITEEQIILVCEKLLLDEEKLYRTIFNYRLGDVNKNFYPLLYTNFSETDIRITDSGEKIVMREEEGVCYYLDYDSVDLLDDKKEWYVKKIEVLPGSECIIMTKKVGATREEIKHAFEIETAYGFELQSESKEEIIYVRDCYVVTIQFKDEVSVKMTFEYFE